MGMPPEPHPQAGYRRVMHCDLDCFFAAVEELDDARLRGKPVIVGGDPDRRGVVSTANYVARRFGVHSAMSAAVARRLCPGAIFLRPRFDRYRELSQVVMAILDDCFDVREQVSIDEAYGELPPGVVGCVPAQTIAANLKARVRAETGLVISVGVARNKAIAKLASDLSKPDGLLVVKPGAERAFLHPLPVGRLNGVGPHTSEKLAAMGIATVGDLAGRSRDEMTTALGKHGAWLWQVAQGQDDRLVIADYGPPRSVSCEDTFERDIADLDRAAEHVRRMAAEVAARVERKRLVGRSVTLKVRWSDFRIMTRQQPLGQFTADAEPIIALALDLLTREIGPLLAQGGAIRLLGVGLHNIESLDAPSGAMRQVTRGYVQLPLFDADEAQTA
ncbi:MAG TPA: DNA polymerase IV [Ktedonobacterales bacterium]|jgi:DNA polymerase-4|nr:DNA polymerase IV [Ktedonobacterales bacterium]